MKITIALLLMFIVFMTKAQSPILNKLKIPETTAVWYPAFKDGKMGYINAKGQEVADFNINPLAKYELKNFTEDFIIIKFEEVTAAYTKKAKQILDDGFKEILYDDISKLFRVTNVDKENNTLGFGEGEAVGFFTLEGKEQIAPKFACGFFECGYEFANGLCFMSKDKKIGFINTKGEWVIKPAYYYTDGFENGFAPIKKDKDGNYGVINTKGEVVVPFNYYSINAFSKNGIAAAIVNKNEASVLINKNGKVVNKLKDLTVGTFFNSVMRFNNNNLVVLDNNTKKLGIINEAGKFIVKPKYSGISLPITNNYLVVNIDGIKAKNDSWCETSGNKWVIIDANTGKEICAPIDAVKLKGINDGMIAFFKYGKWGFLNDKGKEIIPPTYEYEPSAFSNGLARIYGNNPGGFSTDYSIGYIDKTGKEIWPLQK